MSLLSPRLIAFLAVAQCKTVHGAASQINMTQTAVTQRIRMLEHSLQTTLFIRNRKGMLLTPEGKVLLRYCQQIRCMDGEILAKLKGQETNLEIELTLMSPTSMMRSRIIPNLIPIMRKYQNLLINFTLVDEEKRHLHLKANLCDFAILKRANLTHEMCFKKLKPEKYALVCPYAWRRKSLTKIINEERIIDFNHEDSLTFDYLKMHGFDFSNRNRHFANNTNNLAELVSNELGYSVLAKEFAEPYVDNRQLYFLNNGKFMEIEHYLAWFKRTEAPAYFSEIINVIN